MEKYISLFIQIEEMMQSSVYQEGDRLPSIRQLSARYQVSKSTVIRALQELEKRHLIYSVPKSGYYLVKRRGSRITASQAQSTLQRLRRTLIFFRMWIFSIASTKRLIHTSMICFSTERRKASRRSSVYCESCLLISRYLRTSGICLSHPASSRHYPCYVQCRFPMGKRISPLNSQAII